MTDLTNFISNGKPLSANANFGRGTHALPHVLVVEDDEASAYIMDLQLGDIGCTRHIANSGKEALFLLSENSYDIILMDIQMSDINGYEIVKFIREQEASSQKPRQRIIAVTANALVGDRQRCLASDMDGFISKPYHLETLIEVLIGT
jgi:two-component system sensor histidine kinase/response regulator